MAAAPIRAERLVVPLSDPAKPAELEVSLVMGSIKVTGSATQGGGDRSAAREAEDGMKEREEREERRRTRTGMQRIPNTAIGLEAEEEDNRCRSRRSRGRARSTSRSRSRPAARVELSTVNDGDIEVENIDGEVEVSNTNGEIHVKDVSGPVSANDRQRRRHGGLPRPWRRRRWRSRP